MCFLEIPHHRKDRNTGGAPAVTWTWALPIKINHCSAWQHGVPFTYFFWSFLVVLVDPRDFEES